MNTTLLYTVVYNMHLYTKFVACEITVLAGVLQTVNYELTKGYLDLIVTYVSIMILLSRVDDRKAVLGLFNFAYELLHGKAYAFIFSTFVCVIFLPNPSSLFTLHFILSSVHYLFIVFAVIQRIVLSTSRANGG